MWALFLRMESLFKMVPMFFCFLLIANVSELKADQEECLTKRCKHQNIRFPFRLKGLHPDRCGYPGFELSCTEKKQTVLELPQNVKLVVKHIDYKAQRIQLYDSRGCLPLQLPNLNLSASPFQLIPDDTPQRHTVFNCSREENMNYYHESLSKIPCLSSPEFQVLAFPSDSTTAFSLVNCSRTLMNISNTEVYGNMLHYQTGDIVDLVWFQPNCNECEAVGRKCKLKTDDVQDETECFGTTKRQRDGKKILLAMCIILGTCLPGLILFGIYCVHRSRKAMKEGQLKIEKFLEDYRALKPSRYSYVDIKRITDQFKDKLGEGAYGTVFKGRLSNDVLVAVKVLNNFKATGEEFINEVGSMCRIHHFNVTRLIGFCADGNKRALVYEYMPNESLERFIFAAKEDHCLSWEKLQDIAMGIAKGIEYLHQGCDQQILHFDIKPHNILLDHNFNPKISDFGLAKLCSKEQSAVSMTAARGTMGYIAPEVLSRNFGKVTYKLDVYSFGMLLLEMVGGRKNIDTTVESTSQVYFPEWVYSCLDRGEELSIRIENESHAKIARKLTIVGLWCIQWYPADRPSMKAVIRMLEGEVHSLTVPPNPFSHADRVQTDVNIPKKPNNRELAVIPELE